MGFKSLSCGGESKVVKVYPRKREHDEQRPESKEVEGALEIRKKITYYVLLFYGEHAPRRYL